MAAEWSQHVRLDLDMVVRNGRNTLENMYARRKTNFARAADLVYWEARWRRVMRGVLGPKQLGKVKLDRTDICRNVPPTRV